MKHANLLFIIAAAFFPPHPLQAQDKLDIQFGKVTAADFDLSKQKFDSGANAVIIADIGKTSFEGNKKSGMTMVFTRFMRVKIMNKNGFDIADNRILLYNNGSGDQETATDLKGSTFNLENGKVTETKLDQKSIFVEHYDRRRDIKKFTMPDLRAGSVYDLTYTIKSDFFNNLQSWSFQGDYPRLWSEYETTIPPVFHYIGKIQGDDHFDISTGKEVYQHFTIIQNNGTQSDDFYELSGDSHQQRWVKKNVPALKEEPFTTTVENYKSQISFQLNYVQWTKTSERHDYMNTWFKVAEKMMEDEEFGMKLNNDNGWMASDVKMSVNGCKSQEEKIRKIYAFVRDHFSCTGHHGVYAHSSLKEIYKRKNGNVAEINLLLTAMLRQAGITADPVILSTRENGVASQTYPLMEDFNYVICQARSDDKVYNLDASMPYCGFGHLTEACYNGDARIINLEKPYTVNLSPDSVMESKITSVFISNDEKGLLAGNFEQTPGDRESYELREEIKKSSQKDYFKKIQAGLGSEVDIENSGIDSLSNFEEPIMVHYEFTLKNLVTGDVVYFNPMMGEMHRTNPFKSLERHYPVEMPSKEEELYVLNMDIPKGYSIDEIPQSAKVLLNETDGVFEYLIRKTASKIQMRVHLKLNKANFPTEDYATLRDFFAYVVKKENEQIVFKKIP